MHTNLIKCLILVKKNVSPSNLIKTVFFSSLNNLVYDSTLVVQYNTYVKWSIENVYICIIKKEREKWINKHI